MVILTGKVKKVNVISLKRLYGENGCRFEATNVELDT